MSIKVTLPKLLTKPVHVGRLSTEFGHLRELCKSDDHIQLRALFENLTTRSQALPPLIFSLPFLSPVPVPGLSILFGLVIVIAGLCMAMGLKPWLPNKILSKSVSTAFLVKIFDFGARWSRKLEKFVKPRGTFLARHPGMRQMNGVAIATCGLLLALPMPPGTNFPPATALILLSIASLEEDMVVMAAGYLAFLINVILFGALFYFGAEIFNYLPWFNKV